LTGKEQKGRNHVSDNGNALSPIQQFLAGALASAFKQGVRSRIAFVSLYLDQISAKLLEKDADSFIALAKTITGKTFVASNIGKLFSLYYPRREYSAAAKLLELFTCVDAVNTIHNDCLWRFLFTGSTECADSNSGSTPAFGAETDYTMLWQGAQDPGDTSYEDMMSYCEFTSSSLKLGQHLDLFQLPQLKAKEPERFSGPLCQRVVLAALRDRRSVTYLSILEVLVSSFLRREEISLQDEVCVATDVWRFILAPSITAHLLERPQEEDVEARLKTIPVKSSEDGSSPASASLGELGASVPPPAQPPASARPSGDARNKGPEIELTGPEDVELDDQDLEEEPTVARPSEPNAGVSSRTKPRDSVGDAASEFTNKALLIGLLRPLQLIPEDLEPVETLREILNQALSEADPETWQQIVGSTDDITAHGNALCRALERTHESDRVRGIRDLLVALNAASPISDQPSKRPPPPRARTSSAPEISVGTPLPVRSSMTSAQRSPPPPRQAGSNGLPARPPPPPPASVVALPRPTARPSLPARQPGRRSTVTPPRRTP
jgi:hypothetical protein